MPFGVVIDKDVVRRALAKHYRPGDSGTDGPSWLTFIGTSRTARGASTCSAAESILLRSHWVLLVMDVFTRRIIMASVSSVPTSTASRYVEMFNHAVAG